MSVDPFNVRYLDADGMAQFARLLAMLKAYATVH